MDGPHREVSKKTDQEVKKHKACNLANICWFLFNILIFLE